MKAPSPPQGEETARTPDQVNPPRRILVVEDDVCIRRLSIKALIQAGFKVDAAEDGAAAWEILNAAAYDLLITDNSMPRLNGIELLRNLHSAGIVLPVIMATGTLPARELAQSPWLTPNATLLKPFTVDELLAKVRAVLCLSESPENFSRTVISNPQKQIHETVNQGKYRKEQVCIPTHETTLTRICSAQDGVSHPGGSSAPSLASG